MAPNVGTPSDPVSLPLKLAYHAGGTRSAFLLPSKLFCAGASDRRRSQIHRNLLLLVLVQALMAVYVMMPYYISPYIYTVDYTSASNYTLALPNASYVTNRVPWLSAPMLPRVLSQAEHDDCIKLMALIDKLFKKFQVPYILAYGNLVGSFTMHDLLPWDDDIDLLVSWDKYDRFQKFLDEGLKPHGLSVEVHNTFRVYTMKIFRTEGKKAGLRSWTWPFVDIAFYEENSTHVWNQNVQFGGDMLIPKDWFYPITLRPFSSLWLPAPRNTAKFLQMRYGKLKCIKYAWNHKDELPWWSIAYAPCEALQPYYPFVWRMPVKGGVKETLKLDNQVLYDVVINDSFNGQHQPFIF